MIKVFKFGGASVKDANAVKNLKNILLTVAYDRLLIVLSAMGKTTNALEKILESARSQSSDFEILFDQLVDFHTHICNGLFEEEQPRLQEQLNDLFGELRQLLLEPKKQVFYNEHYDQTVSYGELLATTIVAYYLQSEKLDLKLIDARNYIHTDSQFRTASINWAATEMNMNPLVKDFTETKLFLTQGFIGSSIDDRTTTLGREGSDFTAAIFAYCLDAKEVVIWKDVPGLLNADPKRFEDTLRLGQISYNEAIELAWYGATIIHPKTIKPLQNKSIPLLIRSFIEPTLIPSVISNNPNFDTAIPSYIVKDNQMLVSISPRDFSFMNEARLHFVFGILNDLKMRANLLQSSAISLSLCMDEDAALLQQFLRALNDDYAVKYNTNLELLTIRHYTPEISELAGKNREILLEQRSRVTLQLVMKKDL